MCRRDTTAPVAWARLLLNMQVDVERQTLVPYAQQVWTKRGGACNPCARIHARVVLLSEVCVHFACSVRPLCPERAAVRSCWTRTSRRDVSSSRRCVCNNFSCRRSCGSLDMYLCSRSLALALALSLTYSHARARIHTYTHTCVCSSILVSLHAQATRLLEALIDQDLVNVALQFVASTCVDQRVRASHPHVSRCCLCARATGHRELQALLVRAVGIHAENTKLALKLAGEALLSAAGAVGAASCGTLTPFAWRRALRDAGLRVSRDCAALKVQGTYALCVHAHDRETDRTTETEANLHTQRVSVRVPST